MNDRKIIGYFSEKVIKLLDIDISPDTPIYLSESNISHIRDTHTDAYIKYFDKITEIISSPDYVGIAGVYASSIEYIKRFEEDDEWVNVAVRTSQNGVYYLRSMFAIGEGRIQDYLKKKYLKRT